LRGNGRPKKNLNVGSKRSERIAKASFSCPDLGERQVYALLILHSENKNNVREKIARDQNAWGPCEKKGANLRDVRAQKQE